MKSTAWCALSSLTSGQLGESMATRHPAAPCSDHCKHFTVERARGASPRTLLQPCCRKSIDEQANMLFDFLAAENGTVAAGAQKPAERPPARRHPAAPPPPPRHARSMDAIHAVQAARQENDQVKAKSFKIMAVHA